MARKPVPSKSWQESLRTVSERIHLSPPHMSGREEEFVRATFESNWIAPLGPQVDAFEREFADALFAATPAAAQAGGEQSVAQLSKGHALALASGTAGLHLALILAGVEAGDEVLVSTLTFAGSVFPICYLGARPVFIDSEAISWNMDPARLEQALQACQQRGRLPKAVIVVHLYGQSADMEPLLELCNRYGVRLIEDAAEALGARYRDRALGTFGHTSVFSFNGNKIITTSGGGMLVSQDETQIERARKLASQAREPVAHYEHMEIGYNYRMSNLLAGVGRAQLQVLAERVAARRRNFAYYQSALAHLPGVKFMPEAAWGYHNRWLTTLTVEPDLFGKCAADIRAALEAENIEARPVWKPMHMQPVFADYERFGGEVAEELFNKGLCLPSGSQLTEEQLARIVGIIHSASAPGE